MIKYHLISWIVNGNKKGEYMLRFMRSFLKKARHQNQAQYCFIICASLKM